MKKYFEMKETLFLDRDVFEMGYIPELFRFREAQVTKIVSALQSGVQGNSPVNLVIRGPPGTGKTTAVHGIFSEISASHESIIPVYISCHVEESKFDVFARIFEELHIQESVPRGQAVGKMIDLIGKTISIR
ncbi:MAG: AAA family ATPase [Methanomicrobiales archaeon]